MRYLLKENVAESIRTKYKNSYLINATGLCSSYISQIVNRKRALPKNAAYIFTKAINNNLEINDLFDRVK